MAAASGPEPARIVELHVSPRARKDEVVGWRDGALVVRVRAVPEHGKATEAALALAASALGIPRSALRLVSGATSRRKRVAILDVGRAMMAGAPTSSDPGSSSTGTQPGGTTRRSDHSRQHS